MEFQNGLVNNIEVKDIQSGVIEYREKLLHGWERVVYTFDPTANKETGMIGVELDLTSPEDSFQFNARVIVGAKDRKNVPKGMGGDSCYIIEHIGPPEEYTGIRPRVVQIVTTDYLSINGTEETARLWYEVIETNKDICKGISDKLGVDIPWEAGPDCVAVVLDRIYAIRESYYLYKFISGINGGSTDDLLLSSLVNSENLFNDLYGDRSIFQQKVLEPLMEAVSKVYDSKTFSWGWYVNGPSNIQTYALGVKNHKPVLSRYVFSSFADMTAGELDISGAWNTSGDVPGKGSINVNLFNSNEFVDNAIFAGSTHLTDHAKHLELMKKPGYLYGVWTVNDLHDQTKLGQGFGSVYNDLDNIVNLDFATGDGISADNYDPTRGIKMNNLNQKIRELFSGEGVVDAYHKLKSRKDGIFDDYVAVLAEYVFDMHQQRKNFAAMWEDMSPVSTE